MAEDNKTDELKPVGPGAEDLEGEVVVTRPDDDEQRAAATADDDDPDGERVGHGDTDEDREAIRERRREEKQRKKERRQRDLRELNFLRARNEQLERRFSSMEDRQSQGEVLAIDQRIADLETNLKLANDTYAEAIKAQKGAEAAEALDIRDNLRDSLQQAKALKARAVQQDKARREAPRMDPAIQSHADEWMEQNDWFDRTLRDEDSLIAKAIEDGVARSGRFDPRTSDYWDEVTKRVKKRLPHLYEADGRNGNGADDPDADEDPSERRQTPAKPGGPRFTTGGRERPLKKGEVYISPERRAAMEEAGVWDDPVLRARYLKQYQRFDAEHGRRNH